MLVHSNVSTRELPPSRSSQWCCRRAAGATGHCSKSVAVVLPASSGGHWAVCDVLFGFICRGGVAVVQRGPLGMTSRWCCRRASGATGHWSQSVAVVLLACNGGHWASRRGGVAGVQRGPLGTLVRIVAVVLPACNGGHRAIACSPTYTRGRWLEALPSIHPSHSLFSRLRFASASPLLSPCPPPSSPHAFPTASRPLAPRPTPLPSSHRPAVFTRSLASRLPRFPAHSPPVSLAPPALAPTVPACLPTSLLLAFPRPSPLHWSQPRKKWLHSPAIPRPSPPHLSQRPVIATRAIAR